MALTTVPIPYGIRDIKLKDLPSPYTTPGSAVDLPYGQTLSFTEGEGDTQELRGDDVVITSRGGGVELEWELEAGAISLEAYKLMNGGAIAETGTTPNQVKTYTKKTTDAKPRFKAIGQVISDSGGDLWAVLYALRATELSGEFTDQEFFVTNASGTGYGSAEASKTDVLYEFVQHETATAIT